MTPQAAALLTSGRQALGAFDWARAEACFQQACDLEETPEALDGLGQALYFQGRYAEALTLRERAYAGHRRQGDRQQAAAIALQLAQLHALIYDNGTALGGWLRHAERLLTDCPECATHGALELFLAVVAADPDEREGHAAAAVELARRFGAVGLEHDALGYVGKARIERGDVAAGLPLVDEAAAAAAGRLVDDAWAAGSIWCTLFHSCELVVDVRRAEQWIASVDHYVERTDELPIAAICRMHYGGLLTAAGRWDAAEHQLGTALQIYDETYRGTRYEAALRLAELRALQGRLEEAEQLLAEHEHAPLAAVPRARVLLARGEPDMAGVVLRRHLPAGGCGLPEAPAVGLAVEAALAAGDVDEAHTLTAALEQLADRCAVGSIRGAAARARARLLVATGGHDPVTAYEAAIAAYAGADLVYDLAIAQLELATVLATARPGVARGDARDAQRLARRVGAPALTAAASRLLAVVDPDASGPEGSLTPRQREVLDLVARGLSNAEIADRLVISVRTVEHHVGGILAALGLRSRTEAAAYALRRAPGRAGGPAGPRPASPGRSPRGRSPTPG